jgi:arylsulfatase A-like enzyme
MSMQSERPNQEKYVRLEWGSDDRILFDDVRSFLARQTPASPPFFLVMYTNNAHYPYQSGKIPGLRDDPDPKVRHALLTGHVMDLLTDMYASMKASGLADSTLLLAFGDHGQAFGEHAGNYVHSKELYSENMHVPMFLLHPNRLGLPPRISQLGSTDDVMPTMLDIMGIEAPSGSGMSLLNEAPDRLLFQMTPFGPGVVGFRNRRFLYTLSRTGRELLFDLAADPLEQHEVSQHYPDVVRAFRARLAVK